MRTSAFVQVILVAMLLCVASMSSGVSAGGPGDPVLPEDRYVIGLTSHDYANEFFKVVPESEWEYMRNPKVELRWDRVEPKKGAYSWEKIDAQIEALESNGFDDFLLLVNVPTPTWAQDPSYGKTVKRAPPKDPEDWRRFVAQVASRYADVVDYYEILNEPGWDMDSEAMQRVQAHHFGGDVETDYLEMLKAAYEEIKRADPTALVVSGAMMCDMSGEPEKGLWLLDLLTDPEHRMQDWCDAVGLHPYYYPDKWGYAYTLTREMLDSKGIGHEIFVTEIGWPHASDNAPEDYPPEDQYFAIGPQGLGSLVSAGCRKIWVYQDIDDPPSKDYEGFYHGLFDYQGNAMPAWDEFRGWVRVFDTFNLLQPSFPAEMAW